MLGKNVLERIMANKNYGYMYSTGERNPLIGMTVQELCENQRGKYYSSWVLKDKKVLLAICVPNYDLNQEIVKLFIVDLLGDKSTYAIDIKNKDAVWDYIDKNIAYTKAELKKIVKEIKGYYIKPKMKKFK